MRNFSREVEIIEKSKMKSLKGINSNRSKKCLGQHIDRIVIAKEIVHALEDRSEETS